MHGDRGLNTPHDALVRRTFSRPAAVAVLLRRVLPGRLVAHLDLATLRLESSAYVDAVLDPRASDLLHSVRLCGTHHRVAVYIALDHQSSRDGLMPWRSLEYIVDLWDRHIQAQPKPPRKLPFILPILLLQRPAWTTPTRLSDIIDLPAELRNAFGAPVELELLVDDLGGTVLDDPYADEGTLAFVELTRALLYAHENPGAATEERLARLAPLFDTVLEHQDPGDVDSLWTYVVNVFGEGSPIHAILFGAISERSREMYMTTKDEWVAEARAKGRAEALLDMLELRALPPPSAVREHVLATRDEQQLRRWFQRALAAASLDEVFLAGEPAQNNG